MSRIRIAISLALVIFGAGAIAVASGAITTPLLGPANRPIKPTVASPPADEAQSFGLLRRPQTAADRLRGTPAPGQFEVHGANVALARRPDLSTSDPIYMVPGNGDVCLVHGYDMASVCNTTQAAKSGEVISWAPCLPGLKPGQVGVSGFVPDGVTSVRLLLTDGSSISTSVSENAYQVASPGAQARPSAIDFTRSDGVQATVPTPIAADEVPRSC
jgi:hypothetical protein